MIKANNTIFQFYLAIMDSFREYPTEKYPYSRSIEDTKHYQIVNISKIVQMFHSLKLLTKKTLDETSERWEDIVIVYTRFANEQLNCIN